MLDLDLDLFRAARDRIAGHVIATPMVRARAGVVPAGRGEVKRGIADIPAFDRRLDRDVLLKLESLMAGRAIHFESSR